MFQLTYILVCYKQCSQSAGNIMCTLNVCHESFPPAKSRAPNHAAHFWVHSLPLIPSPRLRQPIPTCSDRRPPFAFFASHPTIRPPIGTTLVHPPHPFRR